MSVLSSVPCTVVKVLFRYYLSCTCRPPGVRGNAYTDSALCIVFSTHSTLSNPCI